MKAFMDRDFLLNSKTARMLFHEHADKMPILDYHCHINPEEIAKDRKFENITQVWLGGDHYQWSGGEIHHRRRQRPGKVSKMGGDIGEGNRKSIVSLESSGTEKVFRIRGTFMRTNSRGGMESL